MAFKLLAFGLLLASLPAAPSAEPVGAQITIVVSADARDRQLVAKLILQLAKDGFVTTDKAPRLLYGRQCAVDEEPATCTASLIRGIAASSPTVAVIIDYPEWRSAAARMRCVRLSPAVMQEVAVHLKDALHSNWHVRRGVRHQIAKCITDAFAN
jgi:hypothetical protein